MKIFIIILFLLIGLISNSQLSSIVIRNDTTFSFNPSTGVWTPLIPSSAIWSNIPTSITLNSYSLTSHTHSFSSLTSKPTTLLGYGITDGLKLSDSNVIATKAWRQKGVDSIVGIYGSDYRAANFVAGTHYLAPNGSAASLTSFPTFNQNTTGSAAKWTTARTIWGNSIDGTADITSIIASTYGGTGNGFTKFTGASSSEKTYTLPNASATIASRVAQVDIASTASATSTATIFTPSANGMYRLSIYLHITTTGTSPVAGPVTITYTEPDGSVAQSHVMLLQSVTGTVVTTTVNNSTTTGTVNGSMIFYAKSGVAIQYAIAVSGTFGAGRYMAHLILEAL